MIKLTDKKDCCGCAACVQRCPKHCISMKEDEEGFLYPFIDETVCINCGLCEKTCPIISRPEKLPTMEVLAVKNRKEAERMASSSGGVFIALAKKVIEQGGVVFGAVFDENWEVKHTYSETLDGVKPMMGSKYVQSRIGESFCQAERFLKEGRKVLFTGSPCQITALHNYLHKDYPNLLAVDFLCHGVPSPGVWRRYIDEMFTYATHMAAKKNTAFPSSIMSVPVITSIEFRNKTLNGWKNYCFVVRGSAYSKVDTNAVLLSEIHQDNLFMKGFLADLYLRPSCYRCKCKNGVSHSDLTIGDFWGINRLMPDFDDDKGVGLVLLNTDKGVGIFYSVEMEVRTSNLTDANHGNGGFKEHIVISTKREVFFDNLSHGMTVTDAVSRVLFIPHYRNFCLSVKGRLHNLIRKIIK